MQHQTHKGDQVKTSHRSGKPLIVTRQASKARHPGKGARHDPAPWQRDKAAFGLGQLDENMRLKPNQGIHTSGWNALRMGLVSLLVVWLVSELFVGLVVGLIYGGAAFLSHYLIRLLLWRGGVMPWHYVRFLDEANERILLQRFGGGYRFIHPLFQEYFASLGTAPPPKTVTPPPSHHP